MKLDSDWLCLMQVLLNSIRTRVNTNSLEKNPFLSSYFHTICVEIISVGEILSLYRVALCRQWPIRSNTTLSEIQYERRKTNFVYTWSVEYKFIIKNKFHNWTSKLARIWHIFRKLGYFWLFLSAPVQAFCFCHQMLPVLEHSKRAKNSPIF